MMIELQPAVEQALFFCRTGDWLQLAASPLATTALVEQCWFADEQREKAISPDLRGRALRAIFCWAIDQLRPEGEPDWAARAWRPYLVLYYYYIKGMRLSVLTEQLGIAERSGQNLRLRAVERLVQVLQTELNEAHEQTQRRYYVIKHRIARLSLDQQQMLRYAALFRQPFPPQWFYRFKLVSAESPENSIRYETYELLAAHLLCSDQQGQLFLQPEVRAFIKLLPFPPEQMQWHLQAAFWYEQSQDYLEAAWHQCQAGQLQRAAELLLTHQALLIERSQAAVLYAGLRHFSASSVNATTWIKLNLLAGELAESLHDLDSASEHYRQALAASDLRLKARAFWLRGRVLAAKQGDEALIHYQRCLELLTDLPEERTLLKLVLLHRAWLYIEYGRQHAQATAELKRVQQMLMPSERALWSDLYSAWGEICARQAQQEEAFHYRQSAWLAANEAQDVKRMFNTAHNLAWDYVAMANYKIALHYFEASLTFAQQIGNREYEALFYKGMGACYWGLKHHEQALQAYTTAYTNACLLKNDHLRAQICYALAEAYAACKAPNQLFHYAEEGQTLAQQQRLPDLLLKFQQLIAAYGAVATKWRDLNDRQRAVIADLEQSGAITNRAYRTRHQISAKQAERDLRELVEKQLIVQVGKGRSVHYVAKPAQE